MTNTASTPTRTILPSIADPAILADHPDLQIDITMVGPELAKEWLAVNIQNRKPSPAKQRQYAEDMQDGVWMLTGQAVQFDWNGTLIDGQNRLQTIVSTGVAVPLLVVRGLDPRAREVIDTGKARTASDSATMAGIPNAPVVSAMAKLVLCTDGTLDMWAIPSNTARMRWMRDNHADDPDSLVSKAVMEAGKMARKFAVHGGRVRRGERTLAGSNSEWAALYFRLAVACGDLDTVDLFFEELREGTAPHGSLVMQLRDRILTGRLTGITFADSVRRLSTHILVWNQWVKENPGRSWAAAVTRKLPSVWSTENLPKIESGQ